MSPSPLSLPGLTLVDSVLKLTGIMALPVSSPLVTAGDARILVSPGSKLDDGQFRSMGDVTDLVAPSLLHTAGMAKAAAFFTRARLWGPKGVTDKLPALKWTGTLGETAWPFDASLRLFPLEGMPTVREFVLLHVPSRALLVTDLAFNLVEAQGLGARIALGLFGTWRRFAVSRLFLRFVKDREAFRRSLEPLLASDFDHVLPSHGAPVLGDGKARLRAALVERGLVD
jgi:hypothetical protein